MAFRNPTDKYARRTLTIIIAVFMIMLGGIAYLVRAYNIAATEPGSQSYESVLSQLIGAVAGKGDFYWLSMGAIFLVPALPENTAFADFPRLSRAIANNGFLPPALTLILDYVLQLEKEIPDRQLAVLISQLIETRWYFYLLHNHRSQALKAMLQFHASHRVMIIDIPWYLKETR